MLCLEIAIMCEAVEYRPGVLVILPVGRKIVFGRTHDAFMKEAAWGRWAPIVRVLVGGAVNNQGVSSRILPQNSKMLWIAVLKTLLAFVF